MNDICKFCDELNLLKAIYEDEAPPKDSPSQLIRRYCRNPKTSYDYCIDGERTVPCPFKITAAAEFENAPSRLRVMISSGDKGIIGLLLNEIEDRFDIDIVNSGQDLMHVASRSTAPDLVFLDLSTDNEGIVPPDRLISSIRNHWFSPIIIICRGNDTSAIETACRFGTVDYLVVPLIPSILQSMIRVHLSNGARK